ncbi:MAG: ACP S-malonyltransferase [Deltaproteobacteria bacterium]|jgi:[acyl-carrier-protein] S-malonyltransferase|nr:ACP S-malonyltransferase [Deltaproteobacteria bacterium]MBW2480818.1 ACP S-malonyltransferase [Deltaproteobacteria bacterium]
MKKTAFLFPGQGSQSVGMGEELYREYDVAREIFDMTEEISRINISKLCFKGPMEDLTTTVNLQPAVTAVNLACLAVIEKENTEFHYCAGHSLGEYSALSAAGVHQKEDTVSLVFKRGELMHREAIRNQGAMHAIVGLPIDEVTELVTEVQKDGLVSVANHNTEVQIVITGAPESVEKVSALAVARGAKSVPLNVSGAWHSELIKGAEGEFKAFLDTTDFYKPDKSILFNVTADTSDDPDDIKDIMGRQLCSPVRWYDIISRLMDEKVEVFVEVGPGRVLAGLLKKILPREYPAKTYNVANMKQLEKFLKEV